MTPPVKKVIRDCRKWRQSDCPGDEFCIRWERCGIMNPDAKIPEYEDLKDAD